MRPRYSQDNRKNSSYYNGRGSFVKTSVLTAVEPDPVSLNSWNFLLSNVGAPNGIWKLLFDTPAGPQEVTDTVTGGDVPSDIITALDTALAAFDPADIAVTNNGADLDIVSSRPGWDLNFRAVYIHPTTEQVDALKAKDLSTLLEVVRYNGASFGIPCDTEQSLLLSFYGHAAGLTVATVDIHVFDGAVWHTLSAGTDVSALFVDNTVDLTSWLRVYCQLKTLTGAEISKLVNVS